MTTAEQPGTQTAQLTLPQELILMLLNEESGHFHQVPGWALNCSIAGAALAELSLIGRIDTDMESLHLLDATPTGHEALDPILEAIAEDSSDHSAQYWVETLAPSAESILDVALERLAEMNVLQHHDGDFWSTSPTAYESQPYTSSTEFIKTRIAKVLFSDEIPEPRDVVIIALVNACDVLRFIFQLDEDSERRVELICKMDLIGRAISDAVKANIAGPAFRQPRLAKPIPRVSLTKLIRSPHVREGNMPAIFTELYKEHGPVFEVKFPFREPMIFLAGPETNRWVNRYGRMYLRSKDYFEGLEKVYGASRTIHSLDGGDHFRMRRAMQSSYSRATVLRHLDSILNNARGHMADWKEGDSISTGTMLRLYMNAQISPMMTSLETQDLIEGE
jgi:hypothetical protein